MCLAALRMAHEYFNIQLVLKTKEKCDTMMGRVADAAAAAATYPLLYSRDPKTFITKAHMGVMHTHITQKHELFI